MAWINCSSRSSPCPMTCDSTRARTTSLDTISSDPCAHGDHQGTKCSKRGEVSLYREPEFKVRLPPPALPYPAKFRVVTPTTPAFTPGQAYEPFGCEKTCDIEGEYDSRFCLQTIQQILEGPELQWEAMGEDVLTIWSIYTRASPSGIFLSDVDLMAHILLQLGLNYQRLSYAKEFLDLICTHLAKGIRIRRVGEMVELKRLSYALTILGEAICAGNPNAQAKILGLIGVWLAKATGRLSAKTLQQGKSCSKGTPPPVKEDVRALSRELYGEVFLDALQKSRLPKLLGDYVKDGSYTTAYCALLQILRRFCDCSNLIRIQLSKLPLLDPLLLKLCLEDVSNKILGLTVDLIYALIGKPIEDVTAEQMETTPCPHEGTFQILLTRLFMQLTQFSSKLQLNLRNDVAFTIGLLASKFPPLKTCFGRYAQAIGAIVSRNIFGATADLQITFLVDSTQEDVELLKFLVWNLGLIVSSGTSLHIIEEYQLVPALIAVLMGPSKLIDAMAKRSSTECLESAAWSALITIAQKSPLSFLIAEGAPAMLSYLKVYSEGGSGVDLRLVSMFTHLMRTILSHDQDRSVTEQTIRFFHDIGAMSIFVEGIVFLTSKSCTATEEPMLTNLLLCCSAMGQFQMVEKEEFMQRGGVRVLTRLIRQVIYHPANERHSDPVLHIAIAECIIRCIANCPSALEQFLGHEGLLRTLDLLEIAAGCSTLHMMNCILELCEYPRCMDQMSFWTRRVPKMGPRYACGDEFNPPLSRMPNAIKPKMGEAMGDIIFDHDQSYSALLCQLWRDEEMRWGVARDSDGCVSSLEFPLMSTFAKSQPRTSRTNQAPSTDSGPAGLDLIGSIRPKIFLLVKKITETANTEAELFDGLGLKNQLTMQIIINFLDLKRSEIWLEMWKDFKGEDFHLVQTDAKVMELLVKISRNKVSAVIDTQRYLIQRDKEKDAVYERELYAMIQKCHLQDHLKALREADYIARTTNYIYLVERRLWQKTELQRAVLKAPQNTRIHRTTDGPLNITVWPVRTKIVDSEPHDADPHGTAEPTPTTSSMLQTVEDAVLASMTATTLGEAPSEPPTTRVSRANMESTLGDHWTLRPSAVTEDGADGATPDTAKGGFYQVSAEMLRKALQLLLARQKKRIWMKSVDDDNYWKVRAKWRNDWYPEMPVRTIAFSGVDINSDPKA